MHETEPVAEPPLITRWRQQLESALRQAFEDPASAGDLPLPPPSLILRVNAADKRDPAVFLRSGLADLTAIVGLLDDAGAALPEHP